MCSRSGRSSRWISPACSHSSYGCSAASSALISSSSMIRCSSVSTRNIRPGWSRPLRTMRGRVEVEHADLGGEHDQAVVGDPVAAGAQAVAVEHRADLGAVGEHHAGGAVPRLHQRGVELVERAPAWRPSRCGSPTPPGSSSAPSAAASGRPCAAARAPRRRRPSRRRRGCRSGRAARGRRGSGRTSSSASRARIQLRLPMHGVDLAVVGDEPERVGQRPARERVGREPRVDDRERRGDPLVGAGRGRSCRAGRW